MNYALTRRQPYVTVLASLRREGSADFARLAASLGWSRSRLLGVIQKLHRRQLVTVGYQAWPALTIGLSRKGRRLADAAARQPVV